MTLQQLINRLAAKNGYQIEAADLDGLPIAPTDPIPEDLTSIRLTRMVGSAMEWQPSQMFTIDDVEIRIDTEVRTH